MKLFLASFAIDMYIGNRNKAIFLFTISEAEIRNFKIKKAEPFPAQPGSYFQEL